METVVFVNPIRDVPATEEDVRELNRHLITLTSQVLDRSAVHGVCLVGYRAGIPGLLEAIWDAVCTKSPKAVFFAFSEDARLNDTIIRIALRLLEIEHATSVEAPVYLYSPWERRWRKHDPSDRRSWLI